MNPLKQGAHMFGEAKLQQWRDVLVKLRDRFAANSEQIRAEATQACGGESAGGLSNRPIHLGDLGSQEAEEAVTVGMAENEAALVHEVDDALTRLRQDRFGVCESCSEPIPKARLTALPYARYCVPCAEQHQRQTS
jgi:RNA polymerase-binding transcription factor DksA